MSRLTNNNPEEYDPEIDFCNHCQYRGEPNGCNRLDGECDSYERFLETYYKLREYEDAEEDGLMLRLPCPIGTPLYYIEKSCDCNHYKDELKVSEEFDTMCPHYHPDFWEQVEYCDCQEDDQTYCSINLEMYCDRCKERLLIRKEPFELKHINRVYGTEQFDKNTSLRDVRFLTIEDAEDFREELKKQETKY